MNFQRHLRCVIVKRNRELEGKVLDNVLDCLKSAPMLVVVSVGMMRDT